jgi:hypothetical protein
MITKKLFMVRLKVRPAPHHSEFWKCQCGYLHIWLFADNKEEAGEDAVTLAQILPYEITDENVKVGPGDSATHPEHKAAAEEAKVNGLSWRVIACEIGADEADFFAEP